MGDQQPGKQHPSPWRDWLARVTASYKVQPGVEIYGRVENVFNQKYEEIFGYNTPGIAAYAGVRLTFDDIMGTGATRDR